MSEDKHHHIVEYKNHILVLLLLISLTVITVAITSVELGLNTAAAMVIASIKAAIVLLYFMHLRFDQKIYRFMATIVILIFLAVIVVTFFDYLYR